MEEVKFSDELRERWKNDRTDILYGLIVSAPLWIYIVNSWANFFGSPCELSWYMGMLIGSYWRLRESAIPIAMFTYIAMIILGIQ